MKNKYFERIDAVEARVAKLEQTGYEPKYAFEDYDRLIVELTHARRSAAAFKRSAKMWRKFAWLGDYREPNARYLYKSARRALIPPPF